MVRRVRFSMLAIIIVALSAVITYSSTRWEQPAPPKNDLERLGLKGPVESVIYKRSGTIAVKYSFNLDGNIKEEVLYQNNQPYKTIQYNMGDMHQYQLYPEIPIQDTILLEVDYLVKKGNKKDYDAYSNWTSQAVTLISPQSDYHYTSVEIQSWQDKREIQYFDNPALQPIWRQVGPASMDFAPVP